VELQVLSEYACNMQRVSNLAGTKQRGISAVETEGQDTGLYKQACMCIPGKLKRHAAKSHSYHLNFCWFWSGGYRAPAFPECITPSAEKKDFVFLFV